MYPKSCSVGTARAGDRSCDGAERQEKQTPRWQRSLEVGKVGKEELVARRSCWRAPGAGCCAVVVAEPRQGMGRAHPIDGAWDKGKA